MERTVVQLKLDGFPRPVEEPAYAVLPTARWGAGR